MQYIEHHSQASILENGVDINTNNNNNNNTNMNMNVNMSKSNVVS